MKMIRRIIALFVACSITCVGCGQSVQQVNESENINVNTVSEKVVEDVINGSQTSDYARAIPDDDFIWDEDYDYGEYERIRYEPNPTYKATPLEFNTIVPEYDDLNDDELMQFVEDNLYFEIVNSLDSDEYYVENVQVAYVSKEYIDELNYNSQSNVFFGYTLDELNNLFEGTRYVFTLGDDGQTTVVPFEAYDDVWGRVLKNVAIGTGVILICVTVSVVSYGAGAPAVGAIFAASAKTATEFAVASGSLAAVTSGVITAVETGDINEALKSAALSGSEEFMWGAIGGSFLGGLEETMALKGMTVNGLSMNEAATIQRQSKLPQNIISQMKSMEEYAIYEKTGVKTAMIDGKMALVRDINLTYETELAGKVVTNLERMQLGYSPVDPITGLPYQLHHINQKADATLAILTQAEHQGNHAILHTVGKRTEIDRKAFNGVRKKFWKAFAAAVGG